jgi:ABC-2 type transport system ATP-binding protein
MRLDGVGRRYRVGGEWVLSGVDLSLPMGSLVRIEGANGSGKSTLLRLLAGIDAPSAGKITGRPSSAYVPERFPTSMPLTALNYLSIMARVHGMRGAAATREAKDWMERFGVGAYARTLLAELSKGTAQKVAVAQALMARPGLLALDEAWTGLDHAARAVLDQAVAARVSNGGRVVYVDHNPRPLAGEIDATYMIIDGTLSNPIREPEAPVRDSPALDAAAFAFAQDAAAREAAGREADGPDFPMRDLPMRDLPARERTPELAPAAEAAEDTLVLDPVRDEPPRKRTPAKRPVDDKSSRDRPSPDAPEREGSPAPVGGAPEDTLVLEPIRDEPAGKRTPAKRPVDDKPSRGRPSRGASREDALAIDALPIDGPAKDFPRHDSSVRESPLREDPLREGPLREGPAPAGSIPVGPKVRIEAKGPPGAGPPPDLPGGPHIDRNPDGTTVLTAPAEQGDALLSALLKAKWHIRSVEEKRP